MWRLLAALFLCASLGLLSTCGSGSIAPDAAVCDQLSDAALAQFHSYLDSLPTTCQSDSDCMVFVSFGCYASCRGFWVKKGEVAAATAVATKVCDQYFAAGCPEVQPPSCPLQ
jgi:hypothetical protein